MTIEEAREEAKTVNSKILQLLQEFETKTGATVKNLEILRREKVGEVSRIIVLAMDVSL